jgi:pimeloyl-ACP methyl ester carboxylesterase
LVVVGSVVVGVVGAAVLCLGVFGGGSEHVVTGSALVGFGSGWAMLAVSSAWLTDRPQGWAVVPAVVMAVTGVGLWLVAPGDGGLRAAGWVWPPVLLLLVVWVAVRVRRARLGWSRWLLYLVVGFLALAAVGGAYESVALARDQRVHPMPGSSYLVGGHRLHLDCAGSGSPTVVVENGLGETSPSWGRITPAVAGTTRVCAYDRAGQGWSGDTARPQDGLQVAADLHALLARAGETGPFVLVGHSTGGAYAMTYAARYPQQVAGMVLLDSASPDQFSVLPDYPGFYALYRRASALLPSLGRLGIGHLVAALTSGTSSSGLPEPAAAQARAFAASPRNLRSQRDELSTYPVLFRQAHALTTLGAKPLVVLTATQGQQAGWPTAQDRLATLSTNTSHRHATTTHAGLLDTPTGATTSTHAINDVVHAARTHTPLTTTR